MSDFLERILAILLLVLVVAMVILLVSVVIDTYNLTGTAIGYYEATYCDPYGCEVDQEVHSEYIYPGYALACPSEVSIFQYFIPGKVLIPIYETYYIVDGTCQVTAIP